jgi:hypothetical protein
MSAASKYYDTNLVLPRHGSFSNGSGLYSSPDYLFNTSESSPLRQFSHTTLPTPPLNGHGSITLFDPGQPQYPNPILMPQFIQLFFQEMGSEFPFMSYEETLARFFDKSISAVVANCIAALAVK